MNKTWDKNNEGAIYDTAYRQNNVLQSFLLKKKKSVEVEIHRGSVLKWSKQSSNKSKSAFEYVFLYAWMQELLNFFLYSRSD